MSKNNEIVSRLTSGLDATNDMAAKPKEVPKYLTDYFSKVRKTQFFSITRRNEIGKSLEAKKGVMVLQDFLNSNGYFNDAEQALLDGNSEFRQYLEGVEEKSIGRSLFAGSLAWFDKTGGLIRKVDGDYYHSVRLVVAYFQWLNKGELAVDGTLGKQTFAVLKKKIAEQAEEETAPEPELAEVTEESVSDDELILVRKVMWGEKLKELGEIDDFYGALNVNIGSEKLEFRVQNLNPNNEKDMLNQGFFCKLVGMYRDEPIELALSEDGSWYFYNRNKVIEDKHAGAYAPVSSVEDLRKLIQADMIEISK